MQKNRPSEETQTSRRFKDTEETEKRGNGFKRFAVTVAAVAVITTGVIFMRKRRQQNKMRRYD